MSGDIPSDEKDPASGASAPSPPAAPPPPTLPSAPVAIPANPPLSACPLEEDALEAVPIRPVDAGDLALDLTELLGRHPLLRQIEQGTRPAFGLRLGDAELRRQGVDQTARIGGAGPARHAADGKHGGE